MKNLHSHLLYVAILLILIHYFFSHYDTVLYFCYDKTMQNNIAYVGDVLSLPAINVWDENFLAVYHMSSRPLINIPSILDSTINALHGTPVGQFSESSLISNPFSIIWWKTGILKMMWQRF